MSSKTGFTTIHEVPITVPLSNAIDMEVSFGELGVEMSIPGPGPTVAHLELA